MENIVPIYDLDEFTHLWVNEVMRAHVNGVKANVREIRAHLFSLIPPDFNPAQIGRRLLLGGGNQMAILGVIAYYKNYAILDDCDRVFFAIREFLIRNPNSKSVALDAIQAATSFSQQEVSSILRMVSEYRMFWKSATWAEDNYTLIEIDLGNDDQCFEHILQFTDTKTLILDALHRDELAKAARFDFESDDYQTQEQRRKDYQELCQRIDEIKAELSGTKAANEALTRELDQLRALYFKLNSKTFKQMVMGKFADLALSKLFDKETLTGIYRYLQESAPHLIDHVRGLF